MKFIYLLLMFILTASNALIAEPIEWSLKDSTEQLHQFPQQAVKNKQVTILFFWATWCPYCKQLMPHIQSALYQYKDQLNLKVYAMNIKEDGDPSVYLQKNGYSFDLFPEAETVASKYEIYGTPAVLVFDEKGQMIFDLRAVQVDHLIKKNGSHIAKSVRLAPYWAAEIRRVLGTL